MPQIKNAEIWFAKVDPKRPNRKFNKKNPTWEVQLRTRDKAQKKEWQEMKLPVKTIDPDDDSGVYYRVNLRKKTIKADGEPASPVEVVYGDMKPADPATIGNGSIANIRIYQYDYENEDGQKGVASVLMGIQLRKHVRYTPKAYDDEFTETETEIIEAEDEEDETSSEAGDDSDGTDDGDGEVPADADEDGDEEAPAPKKTPSLKKPAPKDKFD